MLDIFRTLPGILDSIEGAEMVREAVVFAAWRRISGEALAEHAVPIKLDGSRLHLAVSNVMWQRHLKDLCGQMVFKLNAALGTSVVTFIELEINDPAVQARRSNRDSSGDDQFANDAANQISPELARAADAIEDDELRRQFLLAAGKCLVRRRERQTKV